MRIGAIHQPLMHKIYSCELRGITCMYTYQVFVSLINGCPLMFAVLVCGKKNPLRLWLLKLTLLVSVPGRYLPLLAFCSADA